MKVLAWTPGMRPEETRLLECSLLRPYQLPSPRLGGRKSAGGESAAPQDSDSRLRSTAWPGSRGWLLRVT